MARRTKTGRTTRDIEPWPDSLMEGYRIPSEKEIAQRAEFEARAAALVERRCGPGSEVARMLGLSAAPSLEVAA